MFFCFLNKKIVATLIKNIGGGAGFRQLVSVTF